MSAPSNTRAIVWGGSLKPAGVSETADGRQAFDVSSQRGVWDVHATIYLDAAEREQWAAALGGVPA